MAVVSEAPTGQPALPSCWLREAYRWFPSIVLSSPKNSSRSFCTHQDCFSLRGSSSCLNIAAGSVPLKSSLGQPNQAAFGGSTILAHRGSLPKACRRRSWLDGQGSGLVLKDTLPALVASMTRGNQREVDRQRAQARNAKSVTNKDKDGLTAAARKER